MPNISATYFRIKVTVSPIAPVVVAQKLEYTALLNFEDVAASCGLERFPNERLAAWRAPCAVPDYSRPPPERQVWVPDGAPHRRRAAADHRFAVEEKADSDPGLPASPLLYCRGPIR
jgi:hypothetical protein